MAGILDKFSFTAGFIGAAVFGDHAIWKRDIDAPRPPGPAALQSQISSLRRELRETQVQLSKTRGELHEAQKLNLAQTEELSHVWDLADEATGRAAKLERELASSQSENAKLTKANASLNFDLLRFQQQVSSRSSQTAIEMPDTLDDLGGWAEKYLSGRVTIDKRAIKGAKKSKYHDVPTVYQSLLLMAGPYYDVRFNRDESAREHLQRVYEQQRDLLKVDITPVWKSYPRSAPPSYHLNGHLMDYHLKKGIGTDDRNILRIYFYVDGPKERSTGHDNRIVVGHLTSHLPSMSK